MTEPKLRDGAKTPPHQHINTSPTRSNPFGGVLWSYFTEFWLRPELQYFKSLGSLVRMLRGIAPPGSADLLRDPQQAATGSGALYDRNRLLEISERMRVWQRRASTVSEKFWKQAIYRGMNWRKEVGNLADFKQGADGWPIGPPSQG